MKKLLPERKREKPQIILTNLIDVILLLVFFFMITSSFAKDSNKLPINLPAASSGAALEDVVLTIQMDANARIFINGAEVQSSEFPEKIKSFLERTPEIPIVLEADIKTDYGKVVEVLDQVRLLGGTNIGLSTKPKTTGK